MQLDLAASAASLIDIERLVAGPQWRPTRAHSYAIPARPLKLDRAIHRGVSELIAERLPLRWTNHETLPSRCG